MFDVYCPRHQARVLVWTSMIDGIVNHSSCIVVHYHCGCGYPGTWVTGQPRERTTLPVRRRPRLPKNPDTAFVVVLHEPLER